MKKALTLIALAGFCVALIITTGCTKRTKNGRCSACYMKYKSSMKYYKQLQEISQGIYGEYHPKPSDRITPPSQPQNQNLREFSIKQQFCSRCISYAESELKEVAEEYENFSYEISKSKKKDKFCDQCKQDGMTVKIVTTRVFLCEPCEKDAKKSYEEIKAKRW